MTGAALQKHGEKERAAGLLSIVANNPHGGPMSAQARALLAGKTVEEAEAAAKSEPETPLTPEGEPAKGGAS